MNVKTNLIEQLVTIIKELGGDFEPSVEIPADLTHGDFTTNAAMILAKKLKRNPMEIAEEIKNNFPFSIFHFPFNNKEFSIIERIEIIRPGFVNFWLSKEYFTTKLYKLIGEEISFSNIGKGKVAIVEYSSPNIAKPFTVGHLRSTIMGDAIANLLNAIGYEVKKDNHVGDWGTQFGKQIYAIKKWGNEEEIEKSERPVKLLVDLYVKFHTEAEKNPALEDEARKWFKRLENNDEEARRLWQKCIDWSWREFESIYKQLGIEFTENQGKGYGESFFEDKMGVVLEELEHKKLLKESEGAKLVFFPQDKYPPLMIVKKDGATLYSTRDLATDKFRREKYGDDIIIINEVGGEQTLYFQQLYEVEEMLGWFKKEQRVHIKHGLYRFKDEKMSTRKGNVIWLEDVLEEAKRRAVELSKIVLPFHEATEPFGEEDTKSLKTSISAKHNKPTLSNLIINKDIIAIGAIRWNDLKRDSKQDIVFDWDDILNMQGNSGPYMQYTYVRTQSVLRKAKSPQPPLEKGEDLDDTSLVKDVQRKGFLQPEELELLRLLVRFGDVVQSAGERYAPNILCTYLFTLAQAFNLFYQKLPILKAEEEDVRNFRLALTEGTGNVIRKGLELLGIEAPEKM